MINLVPISIKEAKEFVGVNHRHNKPPQGAKFAIGVNQSSKLVGVTLVGRPVSPYFQDGFTAEVLRVCTLIDCPKNVCSMLYGASWRAWKAMGGNRLITYTLQKEKGISVLASGWEKVAETQPSSWNRPKSNRNRVEQEIYSERKYRWEKKSRDRTSEKRD
tara:strand:+ start:49 stop:531 length:483 start_codon:yes stop_codon:yes gene_type:complete